MTILGIDISDLSKDGIRFAIARFLDEPGYHRIATVNPEFLLLAEKNAAFRQALLDVDLRIADGFGIVLAGLLRGRCITRFPGADLMEEILAIANDRKLSVYLSVRADGLSSYEEIRAALLKKYPDITVNGTDFYCRIKNQESRIKIPNSQFSILFCNFGAPSQEVFLSKLKDAGTEIRLAMGVGGSFDYLTGRLRRAPKCLRMIGLEWFWRLILQPKRIGRIWNAVVIFPYRVLVSKRK
jgi:N-acetylglucosaminyldiphosphoundecaprenol N-acetyl-beta-D-mannosaminyltransferase